MSHQEKQDRKSRPSNQEQASSSLAGHNKARNRSQGRKPEVNPIRNFKEAGDDSTT